MIEFSRVDRLDRANIALDDACLAEVYRYTVLSTNSGDPRASSTPRLDHGRAIIQTVLVSCRCIETHGNKEYSENRRQQAVTEVKEVS
ncbi:hypothetical protein N7G274_003366 [Stereocaulon virgatum]|uniref:Uncharacterized protein n=1 Tax=Stereocaulon virgatum TaxID=373712 RepID=A0ABR4AG92_9LECA